MTALPAELHELPLPEKLDLLELLWADIKTAPDYGPPEWHGAVVSERIAKYRSGTARPLNLEQLVREWRKTRPE